MIEQCGMARSAPGLEKALSGDPGASTKSSTRTCECSGDDESFNQSLEKAGRVADFFELAELMCRDALDREESCGGHFRLEHQTPEGEALRDDDQLRLCVGVGMERPDRRSRR